MRKTDRQTDRDKKSPEDRQGDRQRQKKSEEDRQADREGGDESKREEKVKL